MPTVETVDETSRFPLTEELTRALTALMSDSGLEDDEFTVILVDDATIASMNERDRGVTGPTDVLSYPAHEPTDVGFPQVPHLGDVFISLDTAARQAADAGHTLELEVVTLAAHGLTHLRGLDHQTPDEWAPFEAAQELARRLLADLDPREMTP